MIFALFGRLWANKSVFWGVKNSLTIILWSFLPSPKGCQLLPSCVTPRSLCMSSPSCIASTSICPHLVKCCQNSAQVVGDGLIYLTSSPSHAVLTNVYIFLQIKITSKGHQLIPRRIQKNNLHIFLYQNSYRAIYLLSTYQAVKASTSFSFGYLDWWIYDVSHQSLGDRGHMVREGHV